MVAAVLVNPSHFLDKGCDTTEMIPLPLGVEKEEQVEIQAQCHTTMT